MDEQIIAEISRVEELIKKLETCGQYGEFYKELKVQEIYNNGKEKFCQLQNQLNNLREKVCKTSVKIYIFGSVSAGKSKLINGILGQDLFLSAMDHTTKCFVHIMKSPDDKYRIIQGNQEFVYESKETAMEKLEDISTYKSENSLPSMESVKIFIPINSDNKILKDNVELIDSPGTGDTKERTERIRHFMSDADIFIYLLCNDVTEEDERFFNIQVENVQKPDIYILVNKWDQSDQDRQSRLVETYKTLMGKCFGLIEQYGGPKTKNTFDRIKFISAKEIFNIRINNKHPSNADKKMRYGDFERFENDISEYIRNPQIGLCRRYKKETKTLKDNLKRIVDELAKEIRNIDFQSYVRHFEDLKTQVSIFKEITRKDCEKLQLRCKEDIECKVTKMLNTTNIDEKEINKQVKEHYGLIDKSIADLSKELDNQYMKLRSQIENEDDVKESFQQLSTKDLSDVDNTLRQGNDIKVDLEADPLKASRVAVRVLAIVPIISFIATIIHLYRIKTKKETVSETLAELDEEVHKNDSDKLLKIDENILNIKKVFISKADEILKWIENKMKLQKEYKSYLQNLVN